MKDLTVAQGYERLCRNVPSVEGALTLFMLTAWLSQQSRRANASICGDSPAEESK